MTENVTFVAYTPEVGEVVWKFIIAGCFLLPPIIAGACHLINAILERLKPCA